MLALFGPTASGKTSVAEELASRFPAELISADSMQAYRGLPILTDQPAAPTRLVAVWELEHEGSVAEYQQLAHVAIDEVLERVRRRLPHRPTAAELPALRALGALIVDIRPVEQRTRDGELPGAVVVDRNVLEWRLDPTSPHRIPEVTGPDQPIVLVCNEGYASSLAALSLQKLGLARATDLDGGFQGLLASP